MKSRILQALALAAALGVVLCAGLVGGLGWLVVEEVEHKGELRAEAEAAVAAARQAGDPEAERTALLAMLEASPGREGAEVLDDLARLELGLGDQPAAATYLRRHLDAFPSQPLTVDPALLGDHERSVRAAWVALRLEQSATSRALPAWDDDTHYGVILELSGKDAATAELGKISEAAGTVPLRVMVVKRYRDREGVTHRYQHVSSLDVQGDRAQDLAELPAGSDEAAIALLQADALTWYWFSALAKNPQGTSRLVALVETAEESDLMGLLGSMDVIAIDTYDGSGDFHAEKLADLPLEVVQALSLRLQTGFAKRVISSQSPRTQVAVGLAAELERREAD